MRSEFCVKKGTGNSAYMRYYSINIARVLGFYRKTKQNKWFGYFERRGLKSRPYAC